VGRGVRSRTVSPFPQLPVSLLRLWTIGISVFKRNLCLLLFTTALLPAEEIVPGMNKFAVESYKQLAGTDGNFVVSPFSIHNALSMALAGARGETAVEMAAVLQQTYPNAAYHEEFAALIARLKEGANAEAGTELTNAAALWVEQSFALEPEFQEILRALYGAPLAPVDFLENAEGARQTINTWTEEQTKGKIRELFAEGSLNDRTRLVLTTAIYFMGQWQLPFDTNRTAAGSFQLATGDTVNANFMHQTARVGYAENDALQIVELKYGGSDVVFDILLPKAPSGLSSLEGEISGENLSEWLKGVETRMVELAIPKFRVEFGRSLRDMLTAMGMPVAFTDAADFSGINGRKDLAISDVVHKAFIEVTEKGTEAAAATGVSIGVTSLPIVQATFRADHPFAFVLRDTRTGLILFTGRVVTTE
jgi:serpin B